MKNLSVYANRLLLVMGLAISPYALFAQSGAAVAGSSVHSIAPILQKAMPTVVNITASGKVELVNDPFLRKQLQQDIPNSQAFKQGLNFNKSGSGVIVDATHGLIVTNAHMVSQADTMIVNLNDGRKYLARLIGADNDTDIAVIQIQAKKLTALAFADSNQLAVGDFVAAVGNPFGLQQTVTSGIVSGLHRSNLNIEGLEDFIQTDAPINSGNSGGALINNEGKLVGMNTAILADDGGSIGIGFAIPSNMVKSVISQLIQYGKVNRGMLGVMVQNLNPQLASAFNLTNNQGAIVTEVVPYSPAARIGLQVGDIILRVNGQPVQDNGQVRAIVGLQRIGSPVDLSILRNGRALNLATTVASADAMTMQAKRSNPFLYGLTLRDVTQVMNNNEYVQGVSVLTIQPDSLAWSMGLQKGDIIVGANQKPVRTIHDLEMIASQSKDHLLLRVVSTSGSFFILLQ